MGYRVIAPLVYLRVRDVAGAIVSRTYYAGVPVPENVEEDSLKHHLESGLVVKDDDPVADVLGVPAGTPVPGEPPNVPVSEAPVQVSPQERVEVVRQATPSAAPSRSKKS